MASDTKTSGVVLRVLGNNNYLVELDAGDKRVEMLCYLSGKMNQHQIKVIPGDHVTVVVPPRSSKGRITFRDRGA